MKHEFPVSHYRLLYSHAFGVLTGFGGGLLIATVLYRHQSVGDLTDPLRLLGFVMFFTGQILGSRLRKSPTHPKPEA